MNRYFANVRTVSVLSKFYEVHLRCDCTCRASTMMLALVIRRSDHKYLVVVLTYKHTSSRFFTDYNSIRGKVVLYKKTHYNDNIYSSAIFCKKKFQKEGVQVGYCF